MRDRNLVGQVCWLVDASTATLLAAPQKISHERVNCRMHKCCFALSEFGGRDYCVRFCRLRLPSSISVTSSQRTYIESKTFCIYECCSWLATAVDCCLNDTNSKRKLNSFEMLSGDFKAFLYLNTLMESRMCAMCICVDKAMDVHVYVYMYRALVYTLWAYVYSSGGCRRAER